MIYHRRDGELVEVGRYQGDEELAEELPFPVRFRPSVLVP